MRLRFTFGIDASAVMEELVLQFFLHVRQSVYIEAACIIGKIEHI